MFDRMAELGRKQAKGSITKAGLEEWAKLSNVIRTLAKGKQK